MTSLRCVTRRAVPTAFLLFAAALFVVRPAEASRTTTDLRSIVAPSLELPSTSHELASRELLPSMSADPAESSPRFGFAEDLGLLDPEAEPCGFVLFAVEPSRCELTYARNNPIRFTDPDGRLAEDETKKAAQGASVSVGTQATSDASVRANYNAQVSQLKQGDPGASAARSAIKAEARLQTSPAGQVIAEAMRPAAGEAARVGGTVAKTNAGVDAAMGVAGKAGPTLLVFGLGMSTYNVATAGNTTRTLAQESGGWLGALSFGVAGAKGGAVLGVVIAGPPGGAVGGVLGGLGGGVAGFFAGEKAATNVYDATTPRP